MNKRLSILIVPLALAFALPAPAAAQLGPLQLGIGAGLSFPTGDLSDDATPGFHATASVGLNLPLMPVGFRGDLIWQRFPHRTQGNFDGLGGLLNATYGILRLPLARPYIVGGVGMIRWDEPEGDSGTDFAFNVGAGTELRLMGIAGFIEARYLDAGDQHRGVPVTLGLRF